MIKKLINYFSLNSKYYFFSNIFEKISSILFFILIAKLFDTDEYGQIITIFAISNIVLVFFNFGLPVYLQRETSLNNNSSEVLLIIGLFKTIFIIPFYLIVFFYFYFSQSNLDLTLVLVITFATVVMDINNTLNHFYYGKDRFDISFISTIVSRLTLIIFSTILLIITGSLISFLILFLGSAIFQLIFLLVKIKANTINIRFPKNVFLKSKNILLISFPLGLAMFFNLMYDRIDIILIANYLGETSVAQYNIAYSIYKLSGLLFGMVLVPSFNILSKQSKNEKLFNKDFIKTGKSIILIASILFFILHYFGSILIDFVFASKYDEAELLIPILSYAVIGLGLNNFTGIYLNSRAQFKKVMYSALIAFIINVSFNILLIPLFGISAAVYSTIITEYVILVVQIYFIIKINFRQ